MNKFEVYQDTAGEWRWRLKSTNGKVVASGEGYKTARGAKRGCAAVIRAARMAMIVSLG